MKQVVEVLGGTILKPIYIGFYFFLREWCKLAIERSLCTEKKPAAVLFSPSIYKYATSLHLTK